MIFRNYYEDFVYNLENHAKEL